MAGIGDSWGTEQELLHPRGPNGRWIRKAGIAKSIIGGVLDFLRGFRPRSFQNHRQSSQYLLNISGRQGRLRMTSADHRRLYDLPNVNEDLRDGVIDNPSTQRFVEMMDRTETELPDDVILTRIVGVEAFGFTPETAVGTNDDTDPGIRGHSGRLMADRGYSLMTVGDVNEVVTVPPGSVRIVVAAKKGTKVNVPGASSSDSTIFLTRDQPLRITKIKPDGAGGWHMYVTTDESRTAGEIPEPIAGPRGPGRPTPKEREAAIRDLQRIQAAREKRPDEAVEQAEAEARIARGAELPPSAGRVEEERLRQQELERQAQPQAPGTPPPRTEPVVTRALGGEPRPATGPGGVPQGQAPGAVPEAPAAPRRTVDLRQAVRQAGIPAPAAGPNRKRFNDAYEGVISGKKDPIDAARELDRDAADLEAAGDGDADNLRQLSDLIKREYGLEQPEAPAPVKKAAPGTRTEAGLPKVAKPQVKTRRSQREIEAEERNAAAAKAAKKAPKRAPAKKAAKATGFTEAQERAIVDRAKEFRGKERNEEEIRIVRQADEILARRRGEAPAKAGRAPAKKAALAPAKKALPPVAKKAVPVAGVSTEDHVKALESIQTREEAADYLSRVRGKALDDLGRRYSVPGRLTTAQRRDYILDSAVGRRLETEALQEIAPDLGGGGAARRAAKKVAKKAAPEAPGDDLDKMTKAELLTEAERRNITTPKPSWTKDKIKQALRQREEIQVPEAQAPVKAAKKIAPAAVPEPGKLERIGPQTVQVGDSILTGRDGAVPIARVKPGAPEHRVARIERSPTGRYQFFNDQGKLIDSVNPNGKMNIRRAIEAPESAPVKKAAKALPPVTRAEGPSGHPGDTGMARALVPEEQERQVKLDRVRAYGSIGTEVDELITNGASPKALTHRLRTRGKQQLIPDEDMAPLLQAAEAGDNDQVRVLARSLMEREGARQIGSTDEITALDPSNQESLAGRNLPRGTSVVRVVRPGTRAIVDGDDILVARAVVDPASPDEIREFERGRRLVPEGSTAGDRTQVPVDNAPRKRSFTDAWDAAELGTEGSPARSMKQIRDDVASGKITPEEGIRRMEDEIAFNKEDLAEIDANLRESDLTPEERTKLQSNAAVLENGIEAQKKASKFMRAYFRDEKPTAEEIKVQLGPEEFRVIQDATPETLREAAKGAGLEPPKGETKDEMLQDLVRQIAGQVARERGLVGPRKAPAKKAAKAAKKAAPTIPTQREKLDARTIGAGIEFDESDKWTKDVLDEAQRALDGEDVGHGLGKNPTPAAVGRHLDERVRSRRTSNVYENGQWHDLGRFNPDVDPGERAQRQAEFKAEYDRIHGLTEQVERLADRLKQTRRRPVRKAAAPETRQVQAQLDETQARLINEHLERVNGAKSRAEADQALEGLTMPDLRRIAEQIGVKGRSKRDLRDRILDHFKPNAPEGIKAAPDPAQEAKIRDEIQAAYKDLASGKGAFVSLGDIRAKLGNKYDREAVDRVLLRMGNESGTTLVPENIQRSLTDADREGGITLFGRTLHHIRIDEAFDRPSTRPKRISARAKEAGIDRPSSPFSGVDAAEGRANQMLQEGVSGTEVARMLRERARQVRKADLNEEGRRFRVEHDKDSLRQMRKSSAEYLDRLATMMQQQDKKRRPAKKAAPELPPGQFLELVREEKPFTGPAKKAAPAKAAPVKAAPPVKAGRPALSVGRGEGKGRGPSKSTRPALSVVQPGARMSEKKPMRNSWGGEMSPVHFHEDGVIGMALDRMGENKNLDVDGEPLADVVGKLATRAVRGEISQQQLIQELRQLTNRFPENSVARRQLTRMVEQLDAPEEAPTVLPEGSPAPLTTLMQRLADIPLARRGSKRGRGPVEMQAVMQAAKDYLTGVTEQGRNPRVMLRRLQNDLRTKAYNHRHESEEGKFEIDRAIREAMRELEELDKSLARR